MLIYVSGEAASWLVKFTVNAPYLPVMVLKKTTLPVTSAVILVVVPEARLVNPADFNEPEEVKEAKVGEVPFFNKVAFFVQALIL